MFMVKSFSKPEYVPLELGDDVIWWSERYQTYITGRVVELTQKLQYVYYLEDDGWKQETYPVERVYVQPNKDAPPKYPRYRLSFRIPGGLQKIT